MRSHAGCPDERGLLASGHLLGCVRRRSLREERVAGSLGGLEMRRVRVDTRRQRTGGIRVVRHAVRSHARRERERFTRGGRPLATWLRTAAGDSGAAGWVRARGRQDDQRDRSQDLLRHGVRCNWGSVASRLQSWAWLDRWAPVTPMQPSARDD